METGSPGVTTAVGIDSSMDVVGEYDGKSVPLVSIGLGGETGIPSGEIGIPDVVGITVPILVVGALVVPLLPIPASGDDVVPTTATGGIVTPMMGEGVGTVVLPPPDTGGIVPSTTLLIDVGTAVAFIIVFGEAVVPLLLILGVGAKLPELDIGLNVIPSSSSSVGNSTALVHVNPSNGCVPSNGWSKYSF